MANNIYIGARYVPIFAGDWSADVAYEPLTIVNYNNANYTSKRAVPAGIVPTNTTYWALTGNYNAQVEEFRQIAEEAKETADFAVKSARDVGNTLANVGAYRHDDYAPQGGFSDGNYFYQYFYNSATSGRLTCFNLANGAVVSNTPCSLYHGNDFVKVGNYVYGAPYDDGAGNGVNKLLRFRLSDLTTVEELDVFTGTGLNCLFGVTSVDNDTLICALRPYGTNNVNATRLFKYVISTGNVTEITVNWGPFPYFINGFPHPIHYHEGILYITASFESGIYKLDVNEELTAASVIEYTGLPFFDNYGNELLELEAIGMIDRFGSKYLLISFTGYEASVQFMALCLDGDAPISMCGMFPTGVDDARVQVNENGTNIFENGTTTYPFKSLRRALKAVKCGIATNIGLLDDVEHDCIIRDVKCVIYPNHHKFNGTVTVVASNIVFGSTTFEKAFSAIYSSVVDVLGATYKGTIMVGDGGILSESPSTHQGAITVNGGTYRLSSSNVSETLTVSCVGNSLLQLNRSSTAGITAGGGTTVLTPGTK